MGCGTIYLFCTGSEIYHKPSVKYTFTCNIKYSYFIMKKCLLYKINLHLLSHSWPNEMSDELWRSLITSVFFDSFKSFGDNCNWTCCASVMVLISSNVTVGPGLVYTFMISSKYCSLQNNYHWRHCIIFYLWMKVMVDRLGLR